jgi:selenocysteine lyase/cysteine desulfurase
MMFVRKEHIEKTWPLFPTDKPQSGDIHKFEALGTRSFAPEQAIAQAIEFHNAIGSRRKQERLHHLKKYWCDAVTKNPRIKLHISLKPEYSCALGTFSIDGLDVGDINTKLFSEHQIVTTPIKWENVNAVRVTPHVYTSSKDLDRFIDAVLKIAAS